MSEEQKKAPLSDEQIVEYKNKAEQLKGEGKKQEAVKALDELIRKLKPSQKQQKLAALKDIIVLETSIFEELKDLEGEDANQAPEEQAKQLEDRKKLAVQRYQHLTKYI